MSQFIKSLIILIFFAAIAIYPTVHFTTMEEVQFTVKNTERITTTSNGTMSSKYLVFTDVETFENTDSFLSMKFNSSDIYGSIEKGQTCNATVNGYRIPFMSMYRNIIEVECNHG